MAGMYVCVQRRALRLPAATRHRAQRGLARDRAGRALSAAAAAAASLWGRRRSSRTPREGERVCVGPRMAVRRQRGRYVYVGVFVLHYGWLCIIVCIMGGVLRCMYVLAMTKMCLCAVRRGGRAASGLGCARADRLLARP